MCIFLDWHFLTQPNPLYYYIQLLCFDSCVEYFQTTELEDLRARLVPTDLADRQRSIEQQIEQEQQEDLRASLVPTDRESIGLADRQRSIEQQIALEGVALSHSLVATDREREEEPLQQDNLLHDQVKINMYFFSWLHMCARLMLSLV
jgi:hypothetical protein